MSEGLYQDEKAGEKRLANSVRTGIPVWLAVGENTILNSYSIFKGGHGLRIGASCIFAAFVYINNSDHVYAKGELIQKQAFVGAPIEIGDDVWLGGHLSVNKSVRIGVGSVVDMGTVVTRDIPANKVAVGSPARVLKDRV